MDYSTDSGSEPELVRARLKWFNSPKGFGFVIPDGEDIDAFIHVTVLQKAGLSSLNEGADIMCRIRRGLKGAMVTEITEILSNCGQGGAAGSIYSPRADNSDAMDMSVGAIKWYNVEKGYGFVVPDDNGKDVFLHKACLDRKGVKSLDPGQKIVMTIRTVPKGREVVDFHFL